MASDGLRDSSSEDALSDDAVFDEGHVQDDVDHVRLFTVVVFVIIVVDDQILSVRRVHADVSKLLDVSRICKKSVPVDALDRLRGNLGSVKFRGQLIGDQFHLVMVAIVCILCNKPVSFGELDGLVEVREVFIDLDLASRETESVPLQSLLEELLGKENDDHGTGDEHEWGGLADCFQCAEVVAGWHEGQSVCLDIDPSVEDLALAEHPVAIGEEHYRRELEHSDGVLGELVVERWRQLVGVSHVVSL